MVGTPYGIREPGRRLPRRVTNEETVADQYLIAAKADVKSAFKILDPAPRDPLAFALLRVLDDIDAARVKLKDRFS